jgi:hypothetical protein
MKKPTLTNQVSQIMKKLENLPLDLVEIGITQSLISSKIPCMNKETIEKILNSILLITKNNLGEKYDNVELVAYRIDLTESEVFSMDYINHRLILFGNGFTMKIPTLKESLNTYVSEKMGDTLSIDIREQQESEEIYTYLLNQSPNSKRDDKYDKLSAKTNMFYHPDLYDLSEKGWNILDPKELKNSFVVFE